MGPTQVFIGALAIYILLGWFAIRAAMRNRVRECLALTLAMASTATIGACLSFFTNPGN